MDPPFSGFVLDPSECRKLSIEEKRDIIREMSKWPESAPGKLQTWSRKDLLEILCAEIGKERKYTGWTKQKLIENLFRVVTNKKTSGEYVEAEDSTPDQSTASIQASSSSSKRPRKSDHPLRVSVATNNIHPCDENQEVISNIRYCQNVACRATLKLEDAFCKRCSCFICHKYDDNKDPSLWLFCASDALFRGDSCGISCHLECALKHEGAGIVKKGKSAGLDGCYYCINCGKVNDLLRTWKKQLMIAKDARRVDVLCYRISLSHKLLSSTEKYQRLHEIVDMAMKKLEAEVGHVTALMNVSRVIVNRLSVGSEVQKLCASAINLLETMTSSPTSASLLVQEANLASSSFITVKPVNPTSVTPELGSENTMPLQQTAGFSLWPRKTDDPGYSIEPTCTLFKSRGRSLITELVPATEYMFKIVAFDGTRELAVREVGVTTEDMPVDDLMGLVPADCSEKPHCQSPKGNCSGLSHPSEGDESHNKSATYADLNKSPERYFNCGEKSKRLGLKKASESSEHADDNRSQQNSEYVGAVSGEEVIEPDQTTQGHSDSVIDEEPYSRVQTKPNKDYITSKVNHQASQVFPKSENESNTRMDERVIVPFVCSDHTIPATPCRVETIKEGSGRNKKVKALIDIPESGLSKPTREPGSSLEKRRAAAEYEEVCIQDGSLEAAYEYCVKVIRRLECQGHIETNFRVKFLTWFSLRATLQERKIISVYVDTLIDDPASLAGQLVDTFSDSISSKRPPLMHNSFCTKLWQ